jgi:hypothetical protein
VLHRQHHAENIDVADLSIMLDGLLGCEQSEVPFAAGIVEGNMQAPKVATVFSSKAMMSSSRPTSVWTKRAFPPAEVISRTTFSPSEMRRPETTTFAPCWEKATAVALPMPEVPPVMTTVLFSNFFMIPV